MANSNILNFPDKNRVQEEASRWLVRLDAGELSAADALAFRTWLQADSVHRETLVELVTLWDNMELLSELSSLFPLAAKQQAPRPARLSGPLFAPLISTISAVTVGVVLTLLILHPQPLNHSPSDPDNMPLLSAYQTGVGEQSTVSLPDGSVARLNTDSRVEIAFDDQQRSVRLLRGEAHFEVAHSQERPFVVHAGTGIVRAVGTAFTVRLLDEDVEVTVTEGRVEIASAVGTDTLAYVDTGEITARRFHTTIDAGQSAEYDDVEILSVKTIEPELMERKLAWQQGMLMFEGDTLQRVVEEISRYTKMEIVINDPSIRELRVGGYFRAGETQALLEVLQNSFDIKVDYVGNRLVYLTGNPAMHSAIH